MKLIQPFAALIQRGVSLQMNISAAGEQIQLSILPKGKDTKTGVTLPPKALIGTAEEIDQHLEEYLTKYAGTVTRIADVVAGADVDLQAAEKEASAQAKQALDEKRAKNATKPGGAKATPAGGKKERDMGAGLIGGEAEGEDEDLHDDNADTVLKTGGGGGGEPAQSPAASPVGAQAGAEAGGLNAALF